MRARGSRAVTEERVDLTPMIDVVFLLLVFFLTTLQFRVLDGKLPTELPRDRGEGAALDPALLEPLTLHVARAAGGRTAVRLGHDRVLGLGELEQALRAALRRDDALRVRIDPAQGVSYEQIVQVVDRCLAAGVTDVGFAPAPFDA